MHFDNIDYYLAEHLRSCKSSLKICVAWISWDKYERLFKSLAAKGVKIEIIYNNDPKNNQASRLEGVEGIELYAVNTRNKSSIMHNKFCIIDSERVVTGSFNWSRNAETHFENILILINHFKIIKDFKHEFEDLKWYFDYYSIAVKHECGSKDQGARFPCRSMAYYLGILGGSRGINNESTVSVWKLCRVYGHAELVSESEEIYLNDNLFGTDEVDEDRAYDKDAMEYEFEAERAKMRRISDYFANRHGIEVNAVGFVGLANELGHMKFGEEPEYRIMVLWRDMYNRKRIPEELYEGESDGVDEIIETTKNAGYY